MRKGLAALMAIVVTGCATSEPKPAPPPPSAGGVPTSVTLSDAERAAVEAGARVYLQNPPNAVFRTMLASRVAGGATTVCGYVNIGNAGDKPYIGTLNGGAFTVSAIGGTTDQTIAVQTACKNARVYI